MAFSAAPAQMFFLTAKTWPSGPTPSTVCVHLSCSAVTPKTACGGAAGLAAALLALLPQTLRLTENTVRSLPTPGKFCVQSIDSAGRAEDAAEEPVVEPAADGFLVQGKNLK